MEFSIHLVVLLKLLPFKRLLFLCPSLNLLRLFNGLLKIMFVTNQIFWCVGFLNKIPKSIASLRVEILVLVLDIPQ